MTVHQENLPAGWLQDDDDVIPSDGVICAALHPEIATSDNKSLFVTSCPKSNCIVLNDEDGDNVFSLSLPQAEWLAERLTEAIKYAREN